MRQVVFWLHARLSNISTRLARLRHARAGAARPRPGEEQRLALLVLRCRAWVRDDVTEIVEALDGRTAPADFEVGVLQQGSPLRLASEVGGRTRQVVAEPPHAAVVTLLAWDAILERAVERIEGDGSAFVGIGEQEAADAGEPAVAGLDSRQVGLERCP